MPAKKVSRKPDGTFRKGRSGNPSGRSKKSREIEQAVRDALEDGSKANKAIAFILSVMEDAAETTKDRLDAAKTLLAYGYGRPAQRLKISSDEDDKGTALPLVLSA